MTGNSVTHRPDGTGVDWQILRDHLLDILHDDTIRRLVEADSPTAFRVVVGRLWDAAQQTMIELDGRRPPVHESMSRVKALLDQAGARLDRLAVPPKRRP